MTHRSLLPHWFIFSRATAIGYRGQQTASPAMYGTRTSVAGRALWRLFKRFLPQSLASDTIILADTTAAQDRLRADIPRDRLPRFLGGDYPASDEGGGGGSDDGIDSCCRGVRHPTFSAMASAIAAAGIEADGNDAAVVVVVAGANFEADRRGLGVV